MALKDCIEHLYSWDYTIENAYGCPGCVERERIIKLLEEHPCFSLESCQQGCLTHDLLVANIALIKGENK